MDIEQTLKARTADMDPSAQAATAGEVSELLSRLADCRKRLSQRLSVKSVHELAQLRHDVATFNFYRELSRREIGVNTSLADIDNVAEHIRCIEKIVGKAHAGRLLWAKDPDFAAVPERLGVLESAIAEARAAEARWRELCAKARQA